MLKAKFRLAMLTGLLGFGFSLAVGQAQAYPERPVKLIVPWAAGGH